MTQPKITFSRDAAGKPLVTVTVDGLQDTFEVATCEGGDTLAALQNYALLLRPVRNADDFQRVHALADSLADDVGADKSHPLSSLFELTMDLIKQWEDKNVVMPDPEVLTQKVSASTPQFTIAADDDLNDLLNLTAGMAAGDLQGMDIGIMWMARLDTVLSKMHPENAPYSNAEPAPVKMPSPSQRGAWGHSLAKGSRMCKLQGHEGDAQTLEDIAQFVARFPSLAPPAAIGQIDKLMLDYIFAHIEPVMSQHTPQMGTGEYTIEFPFSTDYGPMSNAQAFASSLRSVLDIGDKPRGIPPGCALSSTGALYHNVARMEAESEEAGCAATWMDTLGVPTSDDKTTYSLVGRIHRLLMMYGLVACESASASHSLELLKALAANTENVPKTQWTCCEVLAGYATDQRLNPGIDVLQLYIRVYPHYTYELTEADKEIRAKAKGERDV